MLSSPDTSPASGLSWSHPDRMAHGSDNAPAPCQAVPMAGETDLNVLLSSMTATLVDGIYVFLTLDDQPLPATIKPRMMFQEAEGTTYILCKEDAENAGLDYEFPSRMITLNIHSSLEAVGFMARIATELAKGGMGVNPVSGYFHDHLFVPDGRQLDALQILKQLSLDA